MISGGREEGREGGRGGRDEREGGEGGREERRRVYVWWGGMIDKYGLLDR